MDVNFDVLLDALEETKRKLILEAQEENNRTRKIHLKILQLDIWMKEVSKWK